ANGKSLPDRLAEFLELVESAYVSYKLKLPDEKRDFLKIATSNRQADGKNMMIKLSLPFDEIANRFENTNSSPSRDIPRTWDALLDKLAQWFSGVRPAQDSSLAASRK